MRNSRSARGILGWVPLDLAQLVTSSSNSSKPTHQAADLRVFILFIPLIPVCRPWRGCQKAGGTTTFHEAGQDVRPGSRKPKYPGPVRSWLRARWRLPGKSQRACESYCSSQNTNDQAKVRKKRTALPKTKGRGRVFREPPKAVKGCGAKWGRSEG